MRANKLALMAILLVLALAPATAFAGLAKVGPVIPYDPVAHTGNGFPKYYMDHNGVAVDLQIPPFGDVLNPPTMIFGPVNPTIPLSVDIGFDAECFFWHILPDRATFDDVVGANLNILIGLEAGFAGTTATINGFQTVWQRIRVNWRKTAPTGFYKFIHPYGVENMFAIGGDLLYTIDTLIVPGNFTSALGNDTLLPGKIGPFLQQVNPPVQITALVPPIPPPYNLPTDWLGDGVTPATFTGSPLNPPFNKFRLEAYADAAFTIPMNVFPTVIGGSPTVNFVETDLAVIAGHRYRIPKAVTGALELLLLDGP